MKKPINTPAKPSKAQRQAALRRGDLKVVATNPDPVIPIQEPDTVIPAPIEDPVPPTPDLPPEDEPNTPAEPAIAIVKQKKKKKYSQDALNYFEHRKTRFKMTQVITLLNAEGNTPKSRGAGLRFQKYRDGMTVQQYIDSVKASFSRSEANILDDVHWDYVKGFISVDGKKYPA